MHKYLRAIGFSRIKNRKDERKLLDYVAANSGTGGTYREGEDLYGYLSKSFGKNMGIQIVGNYENSLDILEEQYYYPYVESSVVSSRLPMEIEKYTDRLAFAGSIGDLGLGISLVFRLNNGMDVMNGKAEHLRVRGVSLNALSVSGKVLLPLHKTETEKEKLKTASQRKNGLIEAARNGDEGAMETLTLDEMMIMNNIANRIKKDDIYSIVDTSITPHGLEADQYLLIGEILSYERITNRMTGEECYQLVLDCNQVQLSVMINTEDLLGEPAVGRRFKGEAWLQGTAILE